LPSLLTDLELAPSTASMPPDVRRFLREANRRIDLFQEGARVPGFVPSDFDSVYGLLRTLSESSLARGRQFCEWGSGFGVVACLAALLDFDAVGIEIEPALVREAQQLADDFEIPVEFVAGSYVPRGADRAAISDGNYSWFTPDADYSYDELGLDPSDMDVVFVYPWPDEEPVTLQVFERYCSRGAILITHHGGADYRLRRNAKAQNRRRA
jgi:hypothetical protein